MIRRLYDPKHVPKLIEYGRTWHGKTVLCDIPVNTSKASAFFKGCMMATDTAVWASFDKNNKVRGVLVGSIQEWPYLDGSYATDLLFVADREGRQLYRTFEQWAKSHGANSIQMGVSSGLPQAEAFYENIGLQNVGGIYFQEVKS